jgi:hypothetical protein
MKAEWGAKVFPASKAYANMAQWLGTRAYKQEVVVQNTTGLFLIWHGVSKRTVENERPVSPQRLWELELCQLKSDKPILEVVHEGIRLGVLGVIDVSETLVSLRQCAESTAGDHSKLRRLVGHEDWPGRSIIGHHPITADSTNVQKYAVTFYDESEDKWQIEQLKPEEMSGYPTDEYGEGLQIIQDGLADTRGLIEG